MGPGVKKSHSLPRVVETSYICYSNRVEQVLNVANSGRWGRFCF